MPKTSAARVVHAPMANRSQVHFQGCSITTTCCKRVAVACTIGSEWLNPSSNKETCTGGLRAIASNIDMVISTFGLGSYHRDAVLRYKSEDHSASTSSPICDAERNLRC